MKKTYNTILSNQRGTTIIELILYGGLVVFVLVFVMNFSLNVIETSQKSRSYQEVQQNARVALHRIITELRSAKNLNVGASTFGSNPGVLSLQHRTAGLDPTVLDVSGNTLRIKQGTNPTYALTSSLVKVTNFTLENLSITNRMKIVRITLTVQHINPSNQNFFDASMTVQGAGLIRVK